MSNQFVKYSVSFLFALAFSISWLTPADAQVDVFDASPEADPFEPPGEIDVLDQPAAPGNRGLVDTRWADGVPNQFLVSSQVVELPQAVWQTLLSKWGQESEPYATNQLLKPEQLKVFEETCRATERARVLSHPMLVVTEGSPASIQIGGEVPIPSIADADHPVTLTWGIHATVSVSEQSNGNLGVKWKVSKSNRKADTESGVFFPVVGAEGFSSIPVGGTMLTAIPSVSDADGDQADVWLAFVMSPRIVDRTLAPDTGRVKHPDSVPAVHPVLPKHPTPLPAPTARVAASSSTAKPLPAQTGPQPIRVHARWLVNDPAKAGQFRTAVAAAGLPRPVISNQSNRVYVVDNSQADALWDSLAENQITPTGETQTVVRSGIPADLLGPVKRVNDPTDHTSFQSKITWAGNAFLFERADDNTLTFTAEEGRSAIIMSAPEEDAYAIQITLSRGVDQMVAASHDRLASGVPDHEELTVKSAETVSSPTISGSRDYVLPGDGKPVFLTRKRALTIRSPGRIAAVTEFDPEVIEIEAVAGVDNAIQVTGGNYGASRLQIVDADGTQHRLTILIEDNVTGLQVMIERLYPGLDVEAIAFQGAVLLRGAVDHATQMTQLIEIAEQFYPHVLNQLTVKTPAETDSYETQEKELNQTGKSSTRNHARENADGSFGAVRSTTARPAAQSFTISKTTSAAPESSGVQELRQEIRLLHQDVRDLIQLLKQKNADAETTEPTDQLELYAPEFNSSSVLPSPVLPANDGNQSPLNASGLIAIPVRGPSALYFRAAWCSVCQRTDPIIERVVPRFTPLTRIDVDSYRDLCRKYQVTAVPTVILLNDGKVVDRHTGRTSEENLQRLLQRTFEEKQKAYDVSTANPSVSSHQAVKECVQLLRRRVIGPAQVVVESAVVAVAFPVSCDWNV